MKIDRGTVLVLLLGVVVGVLLGSLLLALYYTADTSIEYFEDGSFVLRGCNPWAICRDSSIGIDTPWEDILPAPLDQAAYYLVELFLKG
jgi:hypothetical protein